jgi:hypothetical protein
LFDTKRHVYTGDPNVWKAERLEWALAHGWPGGADAFSASELPLGHPDHPDSRPEDAWDAGSI